ncbi:zinc ribbon domain-containing protein [Frondihabitans cladoniiphilus]|uniref:C4-type zinc ribbon domain-containing protein n=1 Tax=Frondihabitans cladoniiphilus TaxID=715785 RepID=A0ABP8VNC1_9MICO
MPLLKASPADQALLLDLQTLDTSVQQLAHRTRSLPEIAEIAAIDKQTQALRVRLTAEEGTFEDARRELTRIESDVEIVETRVKRDRDRLQTATSTKDIQALEGELAALANRQSDLDDIQLEVMDRVEQHGAVVSATQAEIDELAVRRAAAEASKEAGLVTIEGQRQHAIADRATLAAKVPADLLALYERQRDRYGVGASHLRAGVSSASGVALNGNDLAAVRAAAPDDVLLCPDSQAVLVRTAESGI